MQFAYPLNMKVQQCEMIFSKFLFMKEKKIHSKRTKGKMITKMHIFLYKVWQSLILFYYCERTKIEFFSKNLKFPNFFFEELI